MPDSDYVFESGEQVNLGSPTENTYVFVSNQLASDGGDSAYTFITGSPLGAGGVPTFFPMDNTIVSDEGDPADGEVTDEGDSTRHWVRAEAGKNAKASSWGGPGDFTGLDTIEVTWRADVFENTAFVGGPSARFGVTDSEADAKSLNQNNAVAGELKENTTGFSKRTDSVDVSSLSGEYYLTARASAATEASQVLEVLVYDVVGKTDTGAEGNYELIHEI